VTSVDLQVTRPAQPASPEEEARRPVSPWPTRVRTLSLVGGVAAIVAWSVDRAFAGPDAVAKDGGLAAATHILAGALHPSLDPQFLEVVARAAVTTLAFAILGTAGALILGLAGGLILGDAAWSGPLSRTSRAARLVLRGIVVAARSVHELIWALLLVSVLGLDPLVAVLALAVPFGAQTAQVYGGTLDSVDREPLTALRAAGVGRLPALAYGLFPIAAPLLVSYAFYRFECALRSAVILGVAGVGGLGFEMIVSLQSRNWGEVWTLIGAFLILVAAVETWSTRVRRGNAIDANPDIHVTCNTCAVDEGKRIPPMSRSVRFTLFGLPIAVGLAAWWVGISSAPLTSTETYERTWSLLSDLYPPALPARGWGELLAATADTLSMAVLATAIAVVITLLVAPAATRMRAGGALGGVWFVGRFLLLILRTVPPTVWAIVALVAFYPGIVAGAVALGLYTGGILGRLAADAWETMDPRPHEALRNTGIPTAVAGAYATAPQSATHMVTFTLHRFEICVRDTVIVGVVGAAGLGRLLSERLAAFDYQVVASALLASLAISVIVEAVSGRVRRTLTVGRI
jgi:phosphonate transport system permease protein